MKRRISAKSIKELKSGTADTYLWDTEISGFGYKLTPAGNASFILQYRTGGRGSPTRRYVIDRKGVLPADKARDLAREVAVEVAQGRDPAKERIDGKLRSISALIDAFEESRKAKGRRSALTMGKTLRRDLLPAWGDRAAAEIRRGDVTLLLDGVVKRGHPQTANKLRRLMHTMFKWALVREWVTVNPVAGIEQLSPEASRERVLTDAELVEVWQASDKLLDGWRDAVRLMILTAQRRTEVGRLPLAEIDLPGALWTISAERSKNGQSDITPLAPQAVTILAERPKFQGCLYALTNDGEKPIGGWSKMKTALDKAILEARKAAAEARREDPGNVLPMPHWTLHDLRRTAATGMGALGVLPNIIDRVLHHSRKRQGIIATYDKFEYLPERRDALMRWAAKVDALVTAAKAAA